MPAGGVTVGIIILAAGGSRRLGTPKQLVREASGETLIARAARMALAADCGPVVVVLGASAEKVRPALDTLPVMVVVNEQWETGMAGSLRLGLMALAGTGTEADAALVMLCDQPAVTPALLNRVVETHRATGHALVVCEYDGTAGVPALFGSALFPALLALQGEEGARRVIKAYVGPQSRLPFPEGKRDVDTPADLAALGLESDTHQ